MRGIGFVTTTDSSGDYEIAVTKCGTEGNTTIRFFVQGTGISATQTFSEGSQALLNLTVSTYCGDGTCNGNEVTGSGNTYPTCNRDCGSGTTTAAGGGGSSGAGGGGGAAAAAEEGAEEGRQEKTFTSVTAETSNTMDIDVAGIPASRVSVTTNTDLPDGFTLTAEGSSTNPTTETPPEGTRFTYLTVSYSGLSKSQISEMEIRFRRPDGWPKDESWTVWGSRSPWELLTATPITTDSHTLTTRGEYRYFAMVGEKEAAPEEGPPREEVEQPPTTMAAPPEEIEEKRRGIGAWIAIILLAAILVIAIVLMRKKAAPPAAGAGKEQQ